MLVLLSLAARVAAIVWLIGIARRLSQRSAALFAAVLLCDAIGQIAAIALVADNPRLIAQRETIQQSLSLAAGLLSLAAVAVLCNCYRQSAQAEARAKALIHGLPDLMFRLRADATFLDCHANPGFEPAIQPELLVGKKPHEVLPPELGMRLTRAVERAAATGQMQTEVYELPASNGEPRDWEARIVANAPDEVLALIRDVSDLRRAESALLQANEELESRVAERTRELAASNDRLQAEIREREQVSEELRASEERWRLIFETQPECVKTVSSAGLLLSMNAAGLEMIEADKLEDVVGLPVGDLIHPKDRSAFLELHRLVCAGHPAALEFDLVGLRGGVRRLHTQAVPLRDRTHGVVHLAVTRDVTERSRAERALREEHAFSRQVIQTVGEGLCVCHETSDYPFVQFTVWNDRMTQITGYTLEEINALGWYQSVYPDAALQARAVERMNRMRGGDDLIAERWQITRKNGEQRTLLITTSALVGERQTHILALMEDITDRLRAEERMREQERQLAHVSRLSTMGEMLAGIAHELNQPLHAIGNFASACQRSLESQAEEGGQRLPEVLSWLGSIQVSVQRSADIIRRLRQFVRRDDGARDVVNFQEIIADSVELLAVSAGDAQVRIEVRATYEPLTVRADKVQIQQVLVNLLRNAIDATRSLDAARREVIVETMQTEFDAEVVVRDQGEGVSPDNVNRLFEPFFSTRREGLGLGLAISKSIVESHGGKIWYDRAAQGGSEFHLTLVREGVPADVS